LWPRREIACHKWHPHSHRTSFPDRRQQPRLPGFLRAPRVDRDLDRRAHERDLRVRVDAREDPDRLRAEGDRGRLGRGGYGTEDPAVSILLVEQNANYALDVARRGYVLETGRIVLADDSARLRNDPEVQRAYLGT
jgi:hypothetical protein